MFAFILRRLAQAVLVMVSVALIAFMLFQYVGDPVVFLLGQDATPEQVRELRGQLGLDQPFLIQFWYFLVNAAQGEFGISLRQGAKVSRLIAERLPATLELALVAGVLALAVGIPMGVYAALKRGTFVSQLFMTISLLGVSLPTFLIGILLILVFSVYLGWLASFGRGEVVQVTPQGGELGVEGGGVGKRAPMGPDVGSQHIQCPPAFSTRSRGSTAKYSRSTIRLMITKIRAIRHR